MNGMKWIRKCYMVHITVSNGHATKMLYLCISSVNYVFYDHLCILTIHTHIHISYLYALYILPENRFNEEEARKNKKTLLNSLNFY